MKTQNTIPILILTLLLSLTVRSQVITDSTAERNAINTQIVPTNFRKRK